MKGLLQANEKLRDQFNLIKGHLSLPRANASLGLLDGASLRLFADEGLVDVRDDAASGNGRLDQAVQLLVTSDGLKEQRNRVEPLTKSKT